MSVHHQLTLSFISIFLFCVDIFLINRIQVFSRNYSGDDIFVDQVKQVLGQLKFSHIIVYTGVYTAVLILCSLFSIIFSFLITIQLISLAVNIGILKKLS
ncbi:hypothetical protein HOG98_05800 [bacterium]|mgnify:FL=1|jgi:hypothetical protein|nr:hypothetical protein [bacterium]